MAINSLLHTGVQGVQSSVRGMQVAADRIAQTATSDTVRPASELAEDIVDLKLYERSAQASAKVIKTADSLLGTLLDTTA
ncbi:MAG: flagellar biosynthesis protein FlgE [Hahellaceae bacterium]|nr:flagellar biosynthesis protein FlgE [Hahellaceae bacterium]MCP5211178.1 flagellar biosynthesis protein FlgE [Hahellaceae bacterium]